MKDGHHRDSVVKMEFMIPSDVLAGLPVVHGHKRNLKDRFELKRTLGEGTYGKVKLAVERTTREPVAIKYIKKSKIQDQHDLNRIRREIKIMSSLQHPHVVRVNEVFENKDRIILVMECANGGELYDYINNNKLTERDARRIFRQITSAISFCHKNGIVHRDLKLENILLDQNNDAKIADFGLSNYYNYASLLETFCGSPLYASPEIVNGQKYHGPEVDCWSLGVVLYTLVYGTMPFDGTNFKKLKSQISAGDYFEPVNPSEAAGLIRHLLTANPAKRANISDICSHWWVNLGFKDMPNGEPYLPSMVLQPVPCSQNLSSSSESDDGEPANRSKSNNDIPLKGILKKPKIVDRVDAKCNENVNNKSSQNAMCTKNENTDPLDDPLDIQPEDNVFEVNDTQTDITFDATEVDSSMVLSQSKVASTEQGTDATFIIDILSSKKVFDSQRMPARSILKRKGKFSAGDSGCELNSPTVKESSSLKSIGMDLSEGDSALESPTGTLLVNNGSLQNDSSSPIDYDQSGAFPFNMEDNTSSKTALSFNAKEGPGLTYSVVPRRRGILKNRIYSKDDSYKRLSACSTGSNSSADILDFSYDSGDESLQLTKYYHEESNSVRNSSDCDVELCYSRPDGLPSFDDIIDFNEARSVCNKALDILNNS